MRPVARVDGLFGLVVAANLVFIPPLGAVAVPLSATLPSSRNGGSSRRLLRRDEYAGEHVVLADCRDPAGVVSSQIAYFPGEPNRNPQDVAIVVTQPGQAALWINTNTSALFTDTGVTFTASLGPAVEEGEVAGIGANDFRDDFICYRKYVNRLYTYDGTDCSQVYVCDHSEPPAVIPRPIAASTNTGLSQGSIIGIAVGVAGGVLFLIAAGLVIWYFRRVRKSPTKRASSDLAQTDTHTLVPPSEVGSDAKPPLHETHPVYEIDGRPCRVEMDTDNGKAELDADGHGKTELDPQPSSSTPPIDEKPLSPTSTAADPSSTTKTITPSSAPDTSHSPLPQYPSIHEPERRD